MGDSTYGQLYVYDLPAHHVRAFYDVLVDDGLALHFAHAGGWAPRAPA